MGYTAASEAVPFGRAGSTPASATNARVVEQQTRSAQTRLPQGMGVQLPPRAPETKVVIAMVRWLRVRNEPAQRRWR